MNSHSRGSTHTDKGSNYVGALYCTMYIFTSSVRTQELLKKLIYHPFKMQPFKNNVSRTLVHRTHKNSTFTRYKLREQ